MSKPQLNVRVLFSLNTDENKKVFASAGLTTPMMCTRRIISIVRFASVKTGGMGLEAIYF